MKNTDADRPPQRRKKSLATAFNTRQHMELPDYEIFYYHDPKPEQISFHRHEYYEFYFFLEGDVVYQVGTASYRLNFGDCLLIPPGVPHRPVFSRFDIPYRRFVIWLSENFCRSLRLASADLTYGFDTAEASGQYLTRVDSLRAREIQGKLVELVEEYKSQNPFHETSARLLTVSFFMYINRMIYQTRNQTTPHHEKALYLNICNYINSHLDGDLSLDALAASFFVSKYHIAHLFKNNMGISPHQYVLKKRLQAGKHEILSGVPFHQISYQYGFQDYTSFYRAFKREFGLSPTEFREQNQMPRPSLRAEDDPE